MYLKWMKSMNLVVFVQYLRKMSVFLVLCMFLCTLELSVGKFVIRFPTVTCKPPLGEDCVEIRTCPFFKYLLDNSPIPRTKSVIDVIRTHQCDFQRNRPFVCCNRTIPHSSLTTTEATTEIEKERIPSTGRFLGPIATHKNFNLLPRNVCGQMMTSSRITNGMTTSINEFPWMALIAYRPDNRGESVVFKCAGTLINERFVLTAAHCISNTTMIGVRLGEYDMDKMEDCDPETGHCAPPPQDFYIESWIIHPQYNQKRLWNDIALIKIDGSANFKYENVHPICLPEEDLDQSGKLAIVAGWGVTEEGLPSSLLRKASVPVLRLSACEKIYQKFSPVTDTQVCAGGLAGRDSCAGDSGGPLKYVGTVDGTTRFVQYGIVSYGLKQCGTDGKPGIYTKVFSFMGWILDQLDR